MAMWSGHYGLPDEPHLPHRNAIKEGFMAKESVKRILLASISLAGVALGGTTPGAAFGQATSSWVHYDSKGKLQYATDANGNRIIDYSSAGYEGGGVQLPKVAAKATVTPSGADDTAAIQ